MLLVLVRPILACTTKKQTELMQQLMMTVLQLQSPTGAVVQTEVLFEAAAANIDKTNYALWQWAGLSARPAYGEMYVALTYDTGTSAAGTVRLVLRGTE